MNFKIILRTLGNLLFMEALLLLPSLGLAFYDGNSEVLKGVLITILILLAVPLGTAIFCRKPERTFYTREGFLLVALSWIVLSAFGCLPFIFSGEIPSFVDAFFEMVSGFTTTGASILTDVEAMSRPLLYWRSFSHWLGGMGILVFMLAIVPNAKGSGDTFHVLRAESPGPSIGKIVPKMRQHALILYGIYLALTASCFALLMVGGMPLFDGICVTFGTVGTGGFSIKADSLASYSIFCQSVVAIFTALSGVNFNLFFLVLLKRWKEALKDEELRVYLGIMLSATILVTLNIAGMFGSTKEAFHHAFFMVSGALTTAGFSAADFNAWPQFSKVLLIILMLLGASAGSTGGGMKISRVIILVKSTGREIQRMLRPRSVISVKMNGRSISEGTIQGVNVYIICHLAILIASFLIVSLDNFSLEATFSAVLACLNNIGVGFGIVGTTGNFSDFSALSKLVLTFNMLLGRLEIFPLLVLFNARSWNRAT